MNDMAIPTLPQPAAQAGQTPAEATGLGRSALRQRFDALPKSVRVKVLEEHRDTNTHYDWWDYVYDQFKEDMDNVGIDVEQVYFSGFWSQGDGACFEGRVCDWGKFLVSVGYDHSILVEHAETYWTLSVKHSGHYNHEHCTSFTSVLELPTGPDDDDFASDYFNVDSDPVKSAVQLAVLSQYSEDSFEREFTEALRSHMRDLYRRLEQEYDYLTSDEAILDSLEANDRLEEVINDAMEEASCLI